MTGVEAAEEAANKAEKAATRLVPLRQNECEEDQGILVFGTPPPPGESQGGTTITLAMRTPERLRGPPDMIPTLAFEPKVRLKLRIEDGARKRRRMTNKRYTESQYEL